MTDSFEASLIIFKLDRAPVGPVTNKKPLGLPISLLKLCKISLFKPSSLNFNGWRFLSKILITIFSPLEDGNVDTLKSIFILLLLFWFYKELWLNFPSWGIFFSDISILAKTLILDKICCDKL